MASVPWPPSVNRLYGGSGRRRHLLPAVRRYRELVACTLRARPGRCSAERYDVHVTLEPPDRRRRDVDNVLKSLLDLIEHAGVIRDDSQVDALTVVRSAPRPPHGRAHVRVLIDAA